MAIGDLHASHRKACKGSNLVVAEVDIVRNELLMLNVAFGVDA